MSQYFVARSVCTSWASYMISRQQRLSSVIAPILLQFCLWYGIFQNFQQFNFAVCRSIWDASSPKLLNGFGWNVVEGRRSVPDSFPSGEPKMYCEILLRDGGLCQTVSHQGSLKCTVRNILCQACSDQLVWCCWPRKLQEDQGPHHLTAKRIRPDGVLAYLPSTGSSPAQRTDSCLQVPSYLMYEFIVQW